MSKKNFFPGSTRVKLKMSLRLTISTAHCAVQSFLILLIMARGSMGNSILRELRGFIQTHGFNFLNYLICSRVFKTANHLRSDSVLSGRMGGSVKEMWWHNRSSSRLKWGISWFHKPQSGTHNFLKLHSSAKIHHNKRDKGEILPWNFKIYDNYAFKMSNTRRLQFEKHCLPSF